MVTLAKRKTIKLNSDFCKNRTKSLVKTIDMGIGGISGLAFGGPKRDILFVLASADVIDTTTGKPIDKITDGSSLYKITGLGVTGVKSSKFKIPEINGK